MESPTQTTPTGSTAAIAGPKEQFLAAYEREHSTTMRVLRAYPPDRLDLKPHPRCKDARHLAWVFVAERMLGASVFKNEFATRGPSGGLPEPPESWDDLLGAVESSHREFGDLIRSTPEEELFEKVTFFVAPKTMGEVSKLEWLWFVLSDEIHHRGQFSIYLRMADGKVPSIYGPTADEPWM